MAAQEFCTYTEGGKRCVAYRRHIGRHDLQPLGSVTVKKILREEDDLRRMGFGDTLVEAIEHELDPRAEQPATPNLDSSNQPVYHSTFDKNCRARSKDTPVREDVTCQLCSPPRTETGSVPAQETSASATPTEPTSAAPVDGTA